MNRRRESWYRKIRSLVIEALIFLARPLEDDREAIWSVPNPLRVLYFPLFTGISIVIAADIAREMKAALPNAPWVTLTREAASEFAPAGIGIAIATLAALQGVATIMAIYQYITNRFTLPVIERHLARGREQGIEEGREQGIEEGREQGIEEGRAEGREQGIEEGRTEANQKWQAWNQRRMDAAANNLPFDEPPPGPQ